MSYLGNKFAGATFVGPPDSWYEPDDDSAWEKACEFAVTWIYESTTIPENGIQDTTVEQVANLYMECADYLCKGLADDIEREYKEMNDAEV
jgi:hypothetical protein